MTKRFYLTSEWWLTIATIVTSLAGGLPGNGQAHAIVAGLAAGAYAISRGLTKSAPTPAAWDPSSLTADPADHAGAQDHPQPAPVAPVAPVTPVGVL
jgi:hypothetical protein